MNDTETRAIKKPVERIMLGRGDLEALELDIFQRRHIERYAMVRQHLYGTVLDCACGVGYGSFLVSKNPDVQRVIGVDCAQEAIDQAVSEFAYEKTRFCCCEMADFQSEEPIDVLVSIETIEHLPDPETLPKLVRRLRIPHVIVSFPSKKTTHYNRYHFHDFRTQDLIDLFEDHLLYKRVELHGEVEMLFFALHPRLTRAYASGRKPATDDAVDLWARMRPSRRPPRV